MLLQKIIRLIAPYDCIGCGEEGSLFCDGCRRVFVSAHTTVTVRGAESLLHIQACTVYYNLAKQLVKLLKFQYCFEAAEHIAYLMANTTTLSDDVVLVPVRTSLSRYRQRGYDQAVLITRRLSELTGLPVADVLLRSGSTRQLGAKRQERLQQLKGAYSVRRSTVVAGKRIILIDDVVTTGATLEVAAQALLVAGVRSVQALVFAAA